MKSSDCFYYIGTLFKLIKYMHQNLAKLHSDFIKYLPDNTYRHIIM